MRTAGSSRLYLGWTQVRDSLWFVPAVSVLVGSLLAIIAVQITTPSTDSTVLRVWFFGGGAAGARGMLTAIAGSLITVTGVVFSVTIVALQLASSQFTPRVLGSFVADRVNQVVLGVFIGTFTYTLLVLRTIRSEADDRISFVPHVAVTLALLLLLVSIAALIVFINHSARSIQASVILQRETVRTISRVEVLFPERVGEPADDDDQAHGERWSTAGDSAFVLATTSGYVQAIHAESLWLPDREHPVVGITVRFDLGVGAFVFPGKRLATIQPAAAVDECLVHAVHDSFVLGASRTIEQDVEFGMILIADIAVRALSPGINDPTTAMNCIDRLTEILASLGTRRTPSSVRQSPSGNVRLIVQPISFDRALEVAFGQILHFGRDNPAIVQRVMRAYAELTSVVPPPLRVTIALRASQQP